MGLLDKLTQLMTAQGLNKHTLAQRSGIPYTTIDGLYKKGYENVKLSTLKKLCSCLNVSLDYLAKDDEDSTMPHFTQVADLSNSEQEVLKLYRSLNQAGQDLALATLRTYAGNPVMIQDTQSASAM